jgi:esterase
VTVEPPEASALQSELAHLRAVVNLSKVSVRELVLPRSRDVVLDHIRLHYLDWLGDANRAAVLLHGGGLTAHTWDVVCLSLRHRLHCYALDLRGHGRSEWSPNLQYGIDQHVGDLERLIDKLGLSDFVLVGMSLGGLVSLAYAAKHSSMIALLAIVDIGPDVQAAGRERIAGFMSQSVDGWTIDQFVEHAMAFNPKRDATLLRASLRHNLHELPDGTWTWRYDRRHRGRWPQQAAQRRLELWSDVERIECEAVILRGAQSDVLARQDADRLARSLKQGTWVEVPAAGHSVQGDNPAGLLHALEPFLRSLELRHDSES